MRAARALATTVAVAWACASCQRIVGIHAYQPLDGAATAGDANRDAPGDGGAASLDAEGGAGADGRATPPSEGGVAGSGDGGGEVVHCADPWHAENVATSLFNIAPASTTACSFSSDALPTFAAALDAADFRGALACGSCLRVQPTFGSASVVVQVVDVGGAGLLINQAAMSHISPGSSSINTDWQLVACDTQSQPLSYFIKDGSNDSYVGIQIRNHRYPVVAVAAVGNQGQTSPLVLRSYNFWENTTTPLGLGPLTLRSTDINGSTVEDSGVVVSGTTETIGRSQFPPCQ